MKLRKVKHPTPYKVSWMHKGHQLLVTEQSEVEFQIGRYQDKVTCDIIPMDVCHVLLGIPWQFDRNLCMMRAVTTECGGISYPS